MPDEAALEFPQGSRLCAVGMPGTGKSVLCRVIFDAFQGYKAVLDPGDSLLTTDESYQETHSTTIAFSDKVPTWRWSPTEEQLDQGIEPYQELYASLFAQKIPMLIWLDEASEASSSYRVPAKLRSELKLGRKIPHTHIMATQRPAEVGTVFWSTASHYAIFHIGFQKDRETIARNIQMDVGQLEEYFSRMKKHGFIWVSMAAEEREDGTVGPKVVEVQEGLTVPEEILNKKGVV